MTSDQSQSQAEIHASTVQQCEDIFQRIITLLAELQELKRAVERRPAVGSKPLPWNQAITGLGAFERLVLSEKRNVDGMLDLCRSSHNGDQNDSDNQEGHEKGDEVTTDLEALDNKLKIRLDACNFKFHQVVWDTAKKCSDLAGLRCEFSRAPTHRKAQTVTADLVVGGGAHWIKLVTTTERRMCYEMTDAGWDWDYEWDCDAEQEASEAGLFSEPLLPEGSEDDVEVARVVRQLVAAATLSYHNYRRPTITILLPRITSGSNPHIDRLLAYVRTLGGSSGVELTVETADESELLNAPIPPLDEALSRLIDLEPFRDFTRTLNVDCSVFMALASDFSHMVIEPESPLLRCSQHKIDAADEMENGPRLITTMYPAMAGRMLVCTQDAADTFLKIAYDIGTVSEQARARLLFEGQEQGQGISGINGAAEFQDAEQAKEQRERDRRRRVAELAKLSVYPVSEDLQLPIRTVGSVTWDDAQQLVAAGELPAVALVVGSKGSGLNAMNVSSFLYGWKARLTTITSNWEAAKRLKTVIETNRVTGDEVGPQIWRIPFARKLLARPRVPGSERAPLKTRVERKQEKTSSLQQGLES